MDNTVQIHDTTLSVPAAAATGGTPVLAPMLKGLGALSRQIASSTEDLKKALHTKVVPKKDIVLAATIEGFKDNEINSVKDLSNALTTLERQHPELTEEIRAKNITEALPQNQRSAFQPGDLPVETIGGLAALEEDALADAELFRSAYKPSYLLIDVAKVIRTALFDYNTSIKAAQKPPQT